MEKAKGGLTYQTGSRRHPNPTVVDLDGPGWLAPARPVARASADDGPLYLTEGEAPALVLRNSQETAIFGGHEQVGAVVSALDRLAERQEEHSRWTTERLLEKLSDMDRERDERHERAKADGDLLAGALSKLAGAVAGMPKPAPPGRPRKVRTEKTVVRDDTPERRIARVIEVAEDVQ